MRTVLDFLFRTDTAILLFRCLKVAGFFNIHPTESGMSVYKYSYLMTPYNQNNIYEEHIPPIQWVPGLFPWGGGGG
jgi:hypothetical protein